MPNTLLFIQFCISSFVLERVKEYVFVQTMPQVGYDLGDQRYLQGPECL